MCAECTPPPRCRGGPQGRARSCGGADPDDVGQSGLGRFALLNRLPMFDNSKSPRPPFLPCMPASFVDGIVPSSKSGILRASATRAGAARPRIAAGRMRSGGHGGDMVATFEHLAHRHMDVGRPGTAHGCEYAALVRRRFAHGLQPWPQHACHPVARLQIGTSDRFCQPVPCRRAVAGVAACPAPPTSQSWSLWPPPCGGSMQAQPMPRCLGRGDLGACWLPPCTAASLPPLQPGRAACGGLGRAGTGPPCGDGWM